MKFNRRTFLIAGGIVGGGMLVGTLGVGAWLGSHDIRSSQRSALSDADAEKLIASYIIIEPDGRVRVLSPHTEMGQGTQTSLLQIILDELDADPATTTIELAPAASGFTHADLMYGLISGMVDPPEWSQDFLKSAAGRMASLANISFTGGSTAIRYTGWIGFRRAAASARMLLAQTGALAMGVPLAEVVTRDSHVIHEASGKKMSYGELAFDAAALPLPEEPEYKPRSEYKYIGKPHHRFDLPDKVFGKPVYGIDTDVPGLRYGAVAPPTIAGGTVTGLANRAEIEAMPGVEAVLVFDDCVAVVADKVWRADWAAKKVQVQTKAPAGGPFNNEALAQQRRDALDGSLSTVIEAGTVSGPLEGDDVIEAAYTRAFAAHTPMEPLNCTAWTEDGKPHVSTGVQGPLNARIAIADIYGVGMDDVTLHAKTMGGGFGRRNSLVYESLNYVTTTCKIQKALGGAVKVTFSREAEMKMSVYLPAGSAVMQARLGPDGKPTEWYGRMYTPVALAEEAKAPYDIPNYAMMSAGGAPALTYGFWRSVDANHTIYFIESFIDELANAAGAVPLEYRKSLLTDPRAVRVLDRVAELSDWSNRPTSGNRAYGVALSGSFGSWTALVLDVEMQDGTPRVHQAWSVIDCGTAVNPGSVEAQMQGGIHWGLTAALYGRIDFDDKGDIRQSNFHNYRIVTFSDAPRIIVDIIDSPEAPVGGVGEVSTPTVAPALLNALAQIGDRPRALPVVS